MLPVRFSMPITRAPFSVAAVIDSSGVRPILLAQHRDLVGDQDAAGIVLVRVAAISRGRDRDAQCMGLADGRAQRPHHRLRTQLQCHVLGGVALRIAERAHHGQCRHEVRAASLHLVQRPSSTHVPCSMLRTPARTAAAAPRLRGRVLRRRALFRGCHDRGPDFGFGDSCLRGSVQAKPARSLAPTLITSTLRDQRPTTRRSSGPRNSPSWRGRTADRPLERDAGLRADVARPRRAGPGRARDRRGSGRACPWPGDRCRRGPASW